MIRDYGSASQSPCAISGNPPVSNITAGATLSSVYCKCTGANQCAAVNASSFTTNATGLGSATLSGALSALPFSNIKNETCFKKGALESATDTYRVSRPPHRVLPCCNPALLPLPWASRVCRNTMPEALSQHSMSCSVHDSRGFSTYSKLS